MTTTPEAHFAISRSRSARLWTGAVLRILRHQRGWTQCSLAQQLGLSDTTWSRFEQGTLPIPEEMLPSLEQHLEIPPGYLHASGSRLSNHFLGATGTAAWRFRKTGEALADRLTKMR